MAKDENGRLRVPQGGSAWLEPAGGSLFLRVTLPPGSVSRSRWVPQDLARSQDESVGVLARDAAEYLAGGP